MPLHVVTVRWGPNYANTLQLNDKTNYFAKTHGLFDGPDQDIILADTVFDAPYDVRARLKERVWSMSIAIQFAEHTAAYNNAVDALHAALYWPGQMQCVVERTGPGNRYILARCENIKEDTATSRVFLASMKSADPVFYQDGAVNTTTGNTGSSPYAPVNLPVYPGSAPALPTIQLKATLAFGIYNYLKTVTLTNPTTHTFHYYPICIDLGDISAAVTAGKFTEVGTNPSGVNPRALRDIRLETQGGARKQIFIRDNGDLGATWHTSVKVWSVIYNLAPGETRVLNLLYGNPNAPYAELYPEASSVKPMFDMYQSSNAAWVYSDFMPPWQLPQTRAMQWTAYIPGADNITWQGFPHPIFDPPVPGSGNTPCAGARCLYHAPATGAAGVQVTSQAAIASVAYGYKMSTNAKTPFVLRSQRPDQRWVDDFADGSSKCALLYLRSSQVIGATSFPLQDAAAIATLTRDGATIAVGDSVAILQDDGTTARLVVSAVNAGTSTITTSTGLTASAAALQPVQQYKVGSVTTTYPSGDRPRTIAFILRGDHPELTSGEWYVAGADTATLNLDTTDAMGMALGSEVNLVGTNQCQVVGQFGNSATAEYLKINTILNLSDYILIDCANRTCMYYHWNGSSYDPPVNRFEALTFLAVNIYWIHVDPALLVNNISFVADPNSNFRSLAVTVTYPTRWY